MAWILITCYNLEPIFNSNHLGIKHDCILPRLGFGTKNNSGLHITETFYISVVGAQYREFQEEQSNGRQKNLMILKLGVVNSVSRDTVFEI